MILARHVFKDAGLDCGLRPRTVAIFRIARIEAQTFGRADGCVLRDLLIPRSVAPDQRTQMAERGERRRRLRGRSR